jgi:hypothetical protein
MANSASWSNITVVFHWAWEIPFCCLYGGEMWSVASKEKHELQMFGNKFLQGNIWIKGLQVHASSYFQTYQPTRCSKFSSLLLVV